MADLQRIQNQMNQQSSLILVIEIMLESADTVLSLEVPNYTPEVEDINRCWCRPKTGNLSPRPALPDYAITDYAMVLYNL